MRALIIEDDPYSIEVLSRLLNKEGLTSSAVHSASHLKPEDVESADIIFLDLEMPNLNGYEVFEVIRAEYGINAPVIVCSVHLEEIENARDYGFDGFIGKPLDPERFTGQLDRILRGQAVWEAA